MRFYNNRQADMLHHVSFFLNQEQAKLVSKVPALKDFIAEFTTKESKLHAITTGNPNIVLHSTLEKYSVKEAFIKQTVKLIAMLKAAGYTYKNKPLPEMRYTLGGLKRLNAAELCKVYENIYKAAVKVKTFQFYGLSPDDMKDMQAFYKEFNAVKNAPTLRKKERTLQHKQLIKGVKDCIAYLRNHIDSSMVIAAEDDEFLQMNYKSARQVLPHVQGRPTDAEVAYRKSRVKKENRPVRQPDGNYLN